MGSLFSSFDNYLPNGVVIDVRTKPEYDEGHINDCIFIPHDEIKDKIEQFVKDKDTPINVYCKAGGRAGKAKTALLEMGYKNVANLGGYSDALIKVPKQ